MFCGILMGGDHEALIGAGAVVWYSGFIIPVTETHPANQAYAYHEDPKTAWGMANNRSKSRPVRGIGSCSKMPPPRLSISTTRN